MTDYFLQSFHQMQFCGAWNGQRMMSLRLGGLRSPEILMTLICSRARERHGLRSGVGGHVVPTSAGKGPAFDQFTEAVHLRTHDCPVSGDSGTDFWSPPLSSLVFTKNKNKKTQKPAHDTAGKNLRGHAVHISLSTNGDIEPKKDFLKFNKQEGPTRCQGAFPPFNC